MAERVNLNFAGFGPEAVRNARAGSCTLPETDSQVILEA
jgi:hypothetical protein